MSFFPPFCGCKPPTHFCVSVWLMSMFLFIILSYKRMERMMKRNMRVTWAGVADSTAGTLFGDT